MKVGSQFDPGYTTNMARGGSAETVDGILYGRHSRHTDDKPKTIAGAGDPAAYLHTPYYLAMLDVLAHEKTLGLTGHVERIVEGTIADGRRLIVIDKVTPLGLDGAADIYHLWHADIGAEKVARENGRENAVDNVLLQLDTAVGTVRWGTPGSRPRFNGYELQPLI